MRQNTTKRYFVTMKWIFNLAKVVITFQQSIYLYATIHTEHKIEESLLKFII